MEKQQADRIITEYLYKIHGFAIKKCYSTNEAEELSAEIIKEVYLSLLKTQEICNLEGYIWRICEHTYYKYVASKKKYESISIDNMEIPFLQDFSSEDVTEEVMKLRREIAFLTAKRREIVFLFYYENKSISYISHYLGIPEGTVKWHLNKSRTEIKEGLFMERKIGKLGLAPVKAVSLGHNGNPDPNTNTATEFYLGDILNLNIVYSVYFSPKSKEEIAQELGITLVFIEDRIKFLEDNGFLVRTDKNHYTTYVKFSPRTYSRELMERKAQLQLKIAEKLAEEYVPLVRESIADIKDIYIPSGNRELLEAAAIFFGIHNRCNLPLQKNLSNYVIKTTLGGDFIAIVSLEQQQTDPDYQPALDLSIYSTCGDMNRSSEKYPVVHSWSVDSKFDSREGYWQNNQTRDYEYLYEFMQGTLTDTTANVEKLKRLRERKYITEHNQINIMIMKNQESNVFKNDFFQKIPELSEEFKKQYANIALEYAMQEAKNYPPQMQDLIIHDSVNQFIGSTVAVMVMDILYGTGTFKSLTEDERVTANLIMFSDVLPQ